MRGLVRSISVIVILFIAGGGVSVQSSGDHKSRHNEAPVVQVVQIDKQEMIEKLSGIYKQWADASIRGDQSALSEHGKQLISLINEDIAATEFRVRELARLAILSDAAMAAGEVDDVKREYDRIPNQNFRRGLSLLNVKETLFRTLNKSRDFSSRYRLMGNYIDLLRGELLETLPAVASSLEETDNHTPLENK